MESLRINVPLRRRYLLVVLNYVKYDDMKKDIKANVRAVDRQIRCMLLNSSLCIALEREQKKMDLDIKKAAKAVKYYS